MTFDADIDLREQGLSAELYRFSFSNGSTLYYTSFERDLLTSETHDGNAYTHIPIERSEYEIDDSLASTRMKITAPVLNLWSSMGIQNGQISVRIVKQFLSDKTYQVVFDGLILSIKKNTGQGEAECASKMYYLEKEIPRIFLQTACNNTLFDSYCSLVKATFASTVTATVSNNGYTLTIESGDYSTWVSAMTAILGTAPPLGLVGSRKGFLSLGQAIFGGEIRYITKQAGQALSLHYPFNGLVSGSVEVQIIPGCDKTPDYCVNVFKNVDANNEPFNFIGMAYIPTSDPTVQPIKSSV